MNLDVFCIMFDDSNNLFHDSPLKREIKFYFDTVLSFVYVFVYREASI